MPTQITPELREWMKLYEAPFEYEPAIGYVRDGGGYAVADVTLGERGGSDDAFGTWLAQQLNELYEQNKEKEG